MVIKKKKCFFPISFDVYFYIFFCGQVGTYMWYFYETAARVCNWRMNYIWYEWSNIVLLPVAKQTSELGLQMERKKMLIVIPVNEIGFGNLARPSPAQWSRWWLICFLLISGFIYYRSKTTFYIIVWNLVSIDRMDCGQPWSGVHTTCVWFLNTFKNHIFYFCLWSLNFCCYFKQGEKFFVNQGNCLEIGRHF